MPAPDPAGFVAHDYWIAEIAPGSDCQLSIAASGAQPLETGDSYTVVRDGCLLDVTVQSVSRGPDGVWIACCRIVEHQWL